MSLLCYIYLDTFILVFVLVSGDRCPVFFFWIIFAYIVPRSSWIVSWLQASCSRWVNADTTKFMVMSRDQNAGWSHNIKTDNISFEREEQFKYLGTTLTDKNSIQEEIKCRLKSGNACYSLVQNLLSSSLDLLPCLYHFNIILPSTFSSIT